METDAGQVIHGMALCVLSGAWLVGILLAAYVQLPLFILISAAITTLIFIILLRHDLQGRLTMLLILCICLGAWRYELSQPAHTPSTFAYYIHNKLSVSIRGVVDDEPRQYKDKRTFVVDVQAISTRQHPTWQTAQGKISVLTQGLSIEDSYGANYGDTIEVQGKLLPSPANAPPGIEASVILPRIHVNNNVGNPLIVALYHLRITCSTIIARVLPQPEAAILIAIVLGLRTSALKPLTIIFNVTGTAHLIAPSGFKVTILAGLIANSTRKLYPGISKKQLAGQYLRDWRYWISTAAILVSIVAYTLLSGAGAAAMRAGIMGSLLFIAPRIGRKYNIYTALALAAFIMSALDPLILWDAGFQLSCLGTLGIVILTPYFQLLLQSLLSLPLGKLINEMFSVTMAAQIATLPIFAFTFHQISFIAPLANLLTVPLLEILLILGMYICGTALLTLPTTLQAAWVAWPLLWYVQQSMLWCASIPAAYITIPENIDAILITCAWLYYFVLALIIFLLYKTRPLPDTLVQQHTTHGSPTLPRRAWRIIHLGIALLIVLTTSLLSHYTPNLTQTSITFLDVRPQGGPPQGEAIFIQTADRKTILIDGGLDPASLALALDSHLPSWQRSLDMVILTSPRPEYINGLQDIVERYTIGAVIDAGMLHPNTTYTYWRRTISKRKLQYYTVARGQTIPVGTQISLQVVWPPAQLHKGSNEVRDNSLILRLVTPHLRLLLLGDVAQSRYALDGIQSPDNLDMFQEDIVQLEDTSERQPLAGLTTVLRKIQPKLIVLTPPPIQPNKTRERKNADITRTYVSQLGSTIVQTAHSSSLEIISDSNGWHIQNT